MSTQKRSRRKKRMPRAAIYVSSLLGLASLVLCIVRWPHAASPLFGLGAVCLLLCLAFLRRRPRRTLLRLMLCGGALLLAGAALTLIQPTLTFALGSADPVSSAAPTSTPAPHETPRTASVDTFEEAEHVLLAFQPETLTVNSALTPSQLASLHALAPATTLDASVLLVETTLPLSSATLSLNETDVSASELIDVLSAFPNLAQLNLSSVDPDTLLSVHTAFPALALTYEYDGIRFDPTLTELDLSAHDRISISTLSALLACSPQLQSVRLPSGPLNAREETMLLDACPDLNFIYPFTLFGTTVYTDAEAIDFGSTKITDAQIPELMEALNRMPSLQRVDMFESRLSDSNYALLFDTYPDIFFGWTLVIDQYTVRTDVTAFSTLKKHTILPRYTWEQLSQLRYCKNLKGLDLGHNALKDLSFLSYFPDLRVLILADNSITDITPIGELENLEYLELFMNKVTDLRPLTNLTHLLDLNLCYNSLGSQPSDAVIDPILSCTALERCWFSNNKLTSDQRKSLTEGFPGCKFDFTVEQSTGNGWRRHDRYYVLRDMMNSRVYQPFS